MASNRAPQAVKAVHPANVMPPASDSKSTPDIVEQLRQLEREVLLRNSELQGRLDTLEPETEGLKQETEVLKQDGEAAREVLDTLTKALADLEIHLGDTHTRTESLEAITRSLNESSDMISRLLDDAIARVNARADHQDDRLADNAESIKGLESRNRALDQLLDEMDGRLNDTAESVTAVDRKHSDFYEKLNSTLVTAATKLKEIDQHQAGQITGLGGRLDSLEPAHAELDRRHEALDEAIHGETGALRGRLDTLEPAHAELDGRHEALKDETGTLRDRIDVLEPAQKALKSAHNSLAVHVSGLDVRADRTDDRLRKGAWTAGLAALLLAVAAGTALWKGYDNRGSLMAAITEQGDWIKGESARLWTGLTTLTHQAEAVDARVQAVDARVDTATARVGQVEDVATDLGGKVSVIEGRIYASDEALNGAPVDMNTIRSEDWLATQPAGNYVVQLLGAYGKRSLANLIARHRDTLDEGQFSYIRTTNGGRDWFVLLYGNYADFDAAMAAMDSLPQRLQKSGPYVRTVAGALKSAARS